MTLFEAVIISHENSPILSAYGDPGADIKGSINSGLDSVRTSCGRPSARLSAFHSLHEKSFNEVVTSRGDASEELEDTNFYYKLLFSVTCPQVCLFICLSVIKSYQLNLIHFSVS